MPQLDFYQDLQKECKKQKSWCSDKCKYFNTQMGRCNYNYAYFKPCDLRFDDSPRSFWARTFVKDVNGYELRSGDAVIIDPEVREVFGINNGIVAYTRGAFRVKPLPGVHNERNLNLLDAIASADGIFRGFAVGNVYDDPAIVNKLK